MICPSVLEKWKLRHLDGTVTGVLGEFGKIPGKLDIPHFVAVDSEGAIYSADFRNWRIDKFVKQ
mgnify:CR=1 FL=1